MRTRNNDRCAEGKSEMKKKELAIRIFAGVMAAVMLVGIIAGVLIYLI